MSRGFCDLPQPGHSGRGIRSGAEGARPPLRPAARRWIEVAGEVDELRHVDSGVVKALFATVDGLLMQALIAEEPQGVEDFEPPLRYLLEPLEYLRGSRY